VKLALDLHPDRREFRVSGIDHAVGFLGNDGGGDVQDERALLLGPLRAELHAGVTGIEGIPAGRQIGRAACFRGGALREHDANEHEVGGNYPGEMDELLQGGDAHRTAGVDDGSARPVPASPRFAGPHPELVEGICAAGDSPKDGLRH
jgi:hypothetical protein